MTRTPNRGEERPLHPLLERVPSRRARDTEDLSEFFYENPRYVEVLTWIADNVGPELAPEGISVRWWGVKPLFEPCDQVPFGQHLPMSLWAKGLYPFASQRDLASKLEGFWKRLYVACPDVDELLRVCL